jgi:colanic acid biosynthesis glycosyl transferase WcaI
MKLLIFGINYFPELTGIAPYTTELAEHFAANNHSVQVVTGVPHYPEWRRRPIPRESGRRNPRVIRYQHFVPKRANALGRMLYEVTWLGSAARFLIASRPDAVFGVVPSLSGGILAVTAARKWRAPVGLIVKDLMGPSASQSGYSGGRSVAWITAKIEAAVLRRADRVAIISDGFLPYVRGAGVPDSRIQRVTDWTHPGAPTESPEACRRRLGWGPADFICLHSGNMGQKQGLDTVLDAATRLRAHGIRVVLAGNGNDRPRLEERVATEGLTNVSFLELQEAGQYEAMLRSADVLLVNQRASVAEMSLPSKLAAYFAAGRPVVAAVSYKSQTAREVRASKAGLIVNPGDPSALLEAVANLKDSPETAAVLGWNGKEYARDNLSSAVGLAGYDLFLQRLCGYPESDSVSDEPSTWQKSETIQI